MKWINRHKKFCPIIFPPKNYLFQTFWPIIRLTPPNDEQKITGNLPVKVSSYGNQVFFRKLVFQLIFRTNRKIISRDNRVFYQVSAPVVKKENNTL